MLKYFKYAILFFYFFNSIEIISMEDYPFRQVNFNQDKYFRIINVGTSASLGINGIETEYNKMNEENKELHWKIKPIEKDYFKLINRKEELPLDIDGLHFYKKHNNDNNTYQQWYIRHIMNDRYKIINRQKNLPLDRNGKIQVNLEENNEDNQKQQWYFREIN